MKRKEVEEENVLSTSKRFQQSLGEIIRAQGWFDGSNNREEPVVHNSYKAS